MNEEINLKQKLLAIIKYDGLLAKKLLLLYSGDKNSLLPLIEDLEQMAFHSLSPDIPPFLPQTPFEAGIDRSKLTSSFVKNVMDKNVFGVMGTNCDTFYALGLRVSLINHDEKPNCIHTFIGNVIVVFTARDICEGEELAIKYNEKEEMEKWNF